MGYFRDTGLLILYSLLALPVSGYGKASRCTRICSFFRYVTGCFSGKKYFEI